jgi:hypothetical protein
MPWCRTSRTIRRRTDASRRATSTSVGGIGAGTNRCEPSGWQFIHETQTLYVLEVHPAGYALFATNEAEKAAHIEVLEFLAFGAFGRVYLGGSEEEIAQGAAAAISALEGLGGRDNPGAPATFY